MSEWHLHWLEANGPLGPWREGIARDIAAAERAVRAILPPPRIDILVSRQSGDRVIPELGVGAWAQGPTLVSIGIAPDLDTFEPSVTDGAIRRLIVHEVNHCLRFGCGQFGRTLGDAIVGEGLAGHFVRHVLGTPPELWEAVLEPDERPGAMPAPDDLARTDYDHGAWFFGTGSHRRWLGYSLGYHAVGYWLAQGEQSITPEDRYAVPTADVLKALPGA